MKVLVVHNRYRSSVPSGENRVVDQEVALLREAGHRVGSFERSSDEIADMSPREKALVPFQVPFNRPVRAALTARLRAEAPDVVHVHNTFPLLSPSVLESCADAGVPVVATLHNYLLVCPVGTLLRAGAPCAKCSGPLPVAAVRHRCYRRSALASVPVAVNLTMNRGRWQSRVARFFCVSESQRTMLVAAGVPADRLSVKPNFVPDPGARRTGPGRHVLFLGRLTEEKGVRLLMAAWDRLDAGAPLLLAGDGPLRERVQRWAATRTDVRCLGLRSPAQCHELLADAAVLVAPSQAPETFGLVAVEAMAAGVPVVASRIGGLPEVVADGVTGLLHRAHDAGALREALRRALADPARNAAWGQAARREYQARFTPEVGLAALVDGYRSAIGSAPSPAGQGAPTLPVR